jgi:hypothetical protein
MSLLHRGTDQVTVFAPGPVGVVCSAVVQPLSSTENDEGTTSK